MSTISAAAVIPPMAHELARYWDQPAREAIVFDDKHAWMSLVTWRALAPYDSSMPSGVYEGKMWRRDETRFRAGRHLLCWFGPSPKPNCCSTNYRVALIIEAVILAAVLDVLVP